MLTIVFYGSDSVAAKNRARAISAHKPRVARVYDVSEWDGRADKCDAVEIMSCVMGWQRKRIEACYLAKIAEPTNEIVSSNPAPYGPPITLDADSQITVEIDCDRQPTNLDARLPTPVVSPHVTQPRRRGRPPGSKNVAA